MKLETIIQAWAEAKSSSYIDYRRCSRAYVMRKTRQREKFWEYIVERIEDYRVCYLQDAARVISTSGPMEI